MLGEPTAQTKWLFEQAGAELPRSVEHLHPLVGSVARKEVFVIAADAARGEALDLIMRHHISVVPVLDSGGKLLGLLSDRMPMANYFYNANAED